MNWIAFCIGIAIGFVVGLPAWLLILSMCQAAGDADGIEGDR